MRQEEETELKILDPFGNRTQTLADCRASPYQLLYCSILKLALLFQSSRFKQIFQGTILINTVTIILCSVACKANGR
jgi:hypothetical protein